MFTVCCNIPHIKKRYLAFPVGGGFVRRDESWKKMKEHNKKAKQISNIIRKSCEFVQKRERESVCKYMPTRQRRPSWNSYILFSIIIYWQVTIQIICFFINHKWEGVLNLFLVKFHTPSPKAYNHFLHWTHTQTGLEEKKTNGNWV